MTQDKQETGATRLPKTVTRYMKYSFTETETRDMSQELARAEQSRQSVAEDKKRVVADFSAKIATLESRIGILSRSLCNGYEFRDVVCEVWMNSPIVGKKLIRRLDTGAVVETLDMKPHEMQGDLDLQEYQDDQGDQEDQGEDDHLEDEDQGSANAE